MEELCRLIDQIAVEHVNVNDNGVLMYDGVPLTLEGLGRSGRRRGNAQIRDTLSRRTDAWCVHVACTYSCAEWAQSHGARRVFEQQKAPRLTNSVIDAVIMCGNDQHTWIGDGSGIADVPLCVKLAWALKAGEVLSTIATQNSTNKVQLLKTKLLEQRLRTANLETNTRPYRVKVRQL